MQTLDLGRDFLVLRLDLGEEVVSTLTEYFDHARVTAASFQGIGAVRGIELGLLETGRREYVRRRFDDEMEIASLGGNVSLREGKTFVHAHVVASDRECRAFGGHLFAAIVSATVEVFVRRFPEKTLWRRPRPELGFFDLDL